MTTRASAGQWTAVPIPNAPVHPSPASPGGWRAAVLQPRAIADAFVPCSRRPPLPLPQVPCRTDSRVSRTPRPSTRRAVWTAVPRVRTPRVGRIRECPGLLQGNDNLRLDGPAWTAVPRVPDSSCRTDSRVSRTPFPTCPGLLSRTPFPTPDHSSTALGETRNRISS